MCFISQAYSQADVKLYLDDDDDFDVMESTCGPLARTYKVNYATRRGIDLMSEMRRFGGQCEGKSFQMLL